MAGFSIDELGADWYNGLVGFNWPSSLLPFFSGA
jgi:hypothetical protein